MAISFPNIDPVAVSIGPLDIRWYGLAYLAGFLLGWAYGLYLAGKVPAGVRPDRDDVDAFLPWGVAGVILGGRLGYVLFYQAGAYLADPLEIFKVWHGGMSFHGGASGVIIALIAFSVFKKINVLRLSDIFCAATPMGLFFGRIANFINGELYGRLAGPDVPWAMVFPGGGDVPRHPSQLYEAGLEGIVLFAVLAVLVHRESVRERPGIVTGVFLAGYGVARGCVEMFREPDAHLGLVLGPFSMGQLLSAPMIVLGLGVIAYALKAGRADVQRAG